MSDVMTEDRPVNLDSISEESIIEWLKKNPSFFNENPEVLDYITPPRDDQGKGIVDFQYYMVKRFKEDRDEVLESAREIVETSRANMSNQSRIHKAILMVLEAHNFEDFIRTITMDFAPLLGVDIISLLVEADDGVIPHINVSGVKVIPFGASQELLGDKMVLLQDKIVGVEAVYGGGAKLVNSQALLRLNLSGAVPSVMVAFGSRDPEMFAEGQATDLLMFLGRVLERCFSLWLDLPPKTK